MKVYPRMRTIQITLLLSLALASAAVPGGAAPVGAAPAGALSVGPDVTIISLSGVNNYTPSGGSACPPGYTGNCRGYSLGTNSCNIGSVPVDWCDQTSGCRATIDEFHPLIATSSDHSVIAQNLYRLKGGRFEQIGLSFLKHGFTSTNSGNSACVWNDNGTPNTSCVFPSPEGGNALGVGCTDFYGAGLNGGRPLGRRSDVQVAGADHPPDPAGGQTNDAYDQRIVVAEEDLSPALNAGALYWMEGHYVVRDDARSANGLNNASYHAATVGALPVLDINLTGSTIREMPAIFAWQAVDPEVEIVQVDRGTFFQGEAADPPATGQTYPDYTVRERFHAAWRVTAGRAGLPFHYEYAIYNMNSDTSADGFSVQFPAAATFGNVGFHDVDHHSGEPYDTADWAIDADGPNGKITWSAVDAGTNTNALRWGTLFSFWFDSDSPPNELVHTLNLFKIDELLDVPFTTPTLSSLIFIDGFESGDTSQWQ